MSTQSPPLNTPPQAGSSHFTKKRLIGFGAIVLVMLVVGGLLMLHHLATRQQTDDATIAGHIHPVSPRVQGTVTRVLVDENQWVKAGQLLVELDPTDYKLAVEDARAALAAAQAQAAAAQNNVPLAQQQAAAQATQAQGGVTSAQSGIQSARAAVAEASASVQTARQQLAEQDANLAKAETDLHRYDRVDVRAVSRQQIDAARNNYNVALATRNAAASQVNQAESRVVQAQKQVQGAQGQATQAQGTLQGAHAQRQQIKVQQGQYTSAKAAIGRAQAALNTALANLSYTRIVAAVDGRVGNKTVEVGQQLQPGQALMAVVSPDLWVVANFKETQLSKIRPGQLVDIHVDAFPDHTFQGKVESFSPASGAQFALLPPENATGNFTKIVQRVPVKILFDAQTTRGYEKLLVPGMSVLATVHTG